MKYISFTELAVLDRILIKLINLTLYANFCCCMSSHAFLLRSEKLAARWNSHSELNPVQLDPVVRYQQGKCFMLLHEYPVLIHHHEVYV